MDGEGKTLIYCGKKYFFISHSPTLTLNKTHKIIINKTKPIPKSNALTLTLHPIFMQHTNTSNNTYNIPIKYRKMENLHIVFWLLKDISWCMVWRPLGIAMILPTLAIASVISYRTRHIKSELMHNLAMLAWITANSYWMLSEFLQFDHKILWASIQYKHIALIPFGCGILILAYYYFYWKPKHPVEIETL